MEKSRDYLFDNYKAFLIFLVVAGHFIGPSAASNEFLRILKWFIVSFHMPAFIFISGYFSKKELPLLNIVQRLAVPYFICEIIYYLWYTFVTHKATGLHLLKPKFTLWYLLALFLWRIVTPYIKKIPYHGILACLAGILIGFSQMEDNFLTIPRALVYYPFYLAGTSFTKDQLSTLRSKSKNSKWLSLLIITAIAIFLCYVGLTRMQPMQVFYGRYNYLSMKQGILEGILWRILLYAIGFLLTFAFMFLVPDRKLCISYIGTRTMAIYLFHGLAYTYLEQCTNLLSKRNHPLETILLLGFCVLLTLVFSLKPFTAFTNTFSKFPWFLHIKKVAS
ncbi:MAG: acyltransferase family protein [Lachnospiraceae bacterium]|nr:acyltransferase family protein [Lachnospiraceae bacterium]